MKYLFIDIDGTLLDSLNNRIPESAQGALVSARNNGHKIFLCTGRPLSQINQFDRNDFDGIICSAGCHVEVNHNTIFEKTLNNEETKQLNCLFTELNLGYVIEGRDANYISDLGMEIFYEMINGFNHNLEIDETLKLFNFLPLQNYNDDKIYKFTFYTPDEEMIRYVGDKLEDQFQLVYTKKDDMKIIETEVMFTDCNKAEGIKKILDYYGASLSDAIGFGDSMNDFEMIQECGIGVAMGNACEELKKISNHITTDILDDGIYNAFIELELI